MKISTAHVTSSVPLILLATACQSDSPTTIPPDPDPVGADVVLEPIRDNTLFEDPAGQLSNGAGLFLFTGMTRDTLRRRALLRFDVAAEVPAGARVDSAQLVLRMDRTIVGDMVHTLHRATADWGEGTSDADFAEGTGTQATTGDATWIHRFYDGSPWSTPGGDFDPTASATQTVGDVVRTYAWGSTARMVQDVQGWLDQPASNFGWILIGDESTHTTAKRFGAREEAGPNRPKLRIFFTSP